MGILKKSQLLCNMKNFNISLLNGLGFQNAAQKVFLAASVLKAATLGGSKVVFVPAVTANPRAVPPVVGVSEIAAPEVKPIAGWQNAIQISKTATQIGIVAYLPYNATPALIGESTNVIGGIKEITPPALQINVWRDTRASATREAIVTEPATLEQYFYKYAQQVSGATIENSTYTIGTEVIPCKKVTLALPATGYIPNLEALQLGKLAETQMQYT
jgi:hypothetical protein